MVGHASMRAYFEGHLPAVRVASLRRKRLELEKGQCFVELQAADCVTMYCFFILPEFPIFLYIFIEALF